MDYDTALRNAEAFGWYDFQGRLVVLLEPLEFVYKPNNVPYDVEDLTPPPRPGRWIVGRIGSLDEHLEFHSGAPIKLLGSNIWTDGSATSTHITPIQWRCVLKFVPDEFIYIFAGVSFREFVRKTKLLVEEAGE